METVNTAASHVTAVESPCSDCARRGHCIGSALVRDEKLPPPVTRGVVPKGEHLFRQGDPAETIFIVRSGAIKSYVCADDGQEEVRGFGLANDAMGIESVCAPRYNANAVAINRTWVCRLPAPAVREKIHRSASFRERVFADLGREFERLNGMLHRGRHSAERRVADFLLTKLEPEAPAVTKVELPMTRADLAHYLGLATETVSRAFTRLQQRGVLRRSSGGCEVVDRDALAHLH